jgi:hypothetical protein
MEGRFWKYAAVKEATIGTELAMTPGRYYQVLAALLTDPAAVAYAPVTVNRLRSQLRSRERRQTQL